MKRTAVTTLAVHIVAATFGILVSMAAPGAAGEEHNHEHGAHGHDDGHDDDHEDGHEDAHDHHEEHAAFEVSDMEKFGVTVGTAAAGQVDIDVELPGEVRPNADRLAHLSAPFPGVVREVMKRVGDRVAKGERLASIESENLTTYALQAAFDGTVIDKHIAPGEAVTREHTLFVIGDLSEVWVEIDVYLDAVAHVDVGRSVHISTSDGDLAADGRISYVSPIVDQATRTVTARVVVPNPDGRWRPGLFVTAVITKPVDAAVVVPRRALHQVEGRAVVFAVDGDHFATRPVTVGVVGRSNVEIKDGLAPGEGFADAGSFLVKAELLKGEATHEH